MIQIKFKAPNPIFSKKKKKGHSLYKYERLFAVKGCFLLSLVKIGRVVLLKNVKM